MARKNNDIVESVYTGYTYKVFNKCSIILSDDIQVKGRKKQEVNTTHFQVRCYNNRVFIVILIFNVSVPWKMWCKLRGHKIFYKMDQAVTVYWLEESFEKTG